MIKFFRVELSLLVWALTFVAIGFYFIGNSAEAADAGVPLTSPTEILSRIHQTDLDEISLGKLAQSQSQSKEVKKFADRMIKDHSANEKDLSMLAKTQNITLRDPVAQNPDDQAKQDKNKATAARLKTLSGAEFDKAYAQAMDAGHQDAIAMVTNAQPTDPLVKRYLAKLLPVLEQHDHLAMTVEKEVKTEAK